MGREEPAGISADAQPVPAVERVKPQNDRKGMAREYERVRPIVPPEPRREGATADKER